MQTAQNQLESADRLEKPVGRAVQQDSSGRAGRNDGPMTYRCPLCGLRYEQPSYLAVHLAAAPTVPAGERVGHGMSELEAWTTAAALGSTRGRPSGVRATA